MLEITILYDNHDHPSDKKLVTRHGFTAYIEYEGKKILFDCGWDGDILLNNAKILGIPLDDLDALFISHGHWDHCGGIISVLKKNKKLNIYLPSDFVAFQAFVDGYGEINIEQVKFFALGWLTWLIPFLWENIYQKKVNRLIQVYNSIWE
jgi:metal-dependent hydrolase (beta-lactamase superfamily II)